MSGDSRPHSPGEPLDDEAIEQLVREAAGAWTMPPIRLDAPSWRDRIRSPRARRMAAARGWLGRVGQAATAGVALTVIGALVAIVLTSPPQGPGKSPDPSSGTPAPSTVARPSVLPRLQVDGDLPEPSRVLVLTEQGDYALVDLEHGTIAGPITGARRGSDLRRRTDGSLICLCLSESGRVNGRPTRADVTLDRYAADGTPVSSLPVESFVGEPDPRDAAFSGLDYPPHLDVAMGYSAGGRYGFVGWSVRASGGWRSGILVVDLLDASIVSRLELPEEGLGQGSARVVVTAPRVMGGGAAGEVLVGRGRETWSGSSHETAGVAFDNDLFRVAFAAGRLANPAPVPHTSDCGAFLLRAGALPDGGAWLACSWADGASLIVRRIDAAGALLPDVTASRKGAVHGDTTALSADGRSLFAWDPIDATLLRIDLQTGEWRTGRGMAAASADAADPAGGPMAAFGAAFGSWLAPDVAAKSLLLGAIVVSPDGSRVYALGVTGGESERETSGSTGIFVFDAATLDPLDHWRPTGDLASLAISADGRFVYAAGLPGLDATGRVLVNQAASVTVHAAEDGHVRVVAGQLGPDMLSFPTPVLD